MPLPILYSLRNCPYAMRARIAIFKSTITVELRDIVLKNKPEEMLLASPKGTVPVLVIPSNSGGGKQRVIDESIDIMLWALGEKDPANLLRANSQENIYKQFDSQSNTEDILNLIFRFDHEFKSRLEDYKCAKRYHESNLQQCRQECEVYIQLLEDKLTEQQYLFGDLESMADIAILPFIRQFAKVERKWYLQSPYPGVKSWLNRYLQSIMFNKVMTQYPLWIKAQPILKFGGV
ncbi:glutathione S-transferase [Paraglaciecola sp.]|uniref:glutathione S-transferase n=1 Tax=Paraglaciecola sp. TaxID=1920173 RepID=UPI003EF68D5A